MFEVNWTGGRPQPVERPRVRFNEGNKTYYTYNPPNYAEYKETLKDFFNQYENDVLLEELFNPKKIVYGLSIKIIFRLWRSTEEELDSNPFYTLRPDIDNLFKAVVDSLFQSNINQIPNGYVVDKDGNELLDENGEKIVKYKQKIDDCRVIHAEILKLRVETKEEEGFKLIIRNVGKEEIQ